MRKSNLITVGTIAVLGLALYASSSPQEGGEDKVSGVAMQPTTTKQYTDSSGNTHISVTHYLIVRTWVSGKTETISDTSGQWKTISNK